MAQQRIHGMSHVPPVDLRAAVLQALRAAFSHLQQQVTAAGLFAFLLASLALLA
jgi:hypothetical protein